MRYWPYVLAMVVFMRAWGMFRARQFGARGREYLRGNTQAILLLIVLYLVYVAYDLYSRH